MTLHCRETTPVDREYFRLAFVPGYRSNLKVAGQHRHAKGSTIFGITWAGPFLMSHDYCTVYGKVTCLFCSSTPSQGTSDFLKCGQTTPSEPPGEPKARRPLRMTIFSVAEQWQCHVIGTNNTSTEDTCHFWELGNISPTRSCLVS